MAGVAHFITGYEQITWNRVCYLNFLMWSLLLRDLTNQNFVKLTDSNFVTRKACLR